MIKKFFKIFRCLFFAVITILQLSCLCLNQVYADTSEAVIDHDTGSLQIHYSDILDGRESAISGAEFSLYRIGEIDAYGNYISLINPILENLSSDDQANTGLKDIVNENNYLEVDKIDDTVLSALSNELSAEFADSSEKNTVCIGKTDENGLLHFEGLDLGLYLVVESGPAEHHLAAQPFLAGIPYTEEGQSWQYDLEAEPKSVPCADLKIQKTVTGDGEKDRDFHFKISFNNLNQDDNMQPQTWTAVKSDGTSSEVKNGDIITLCHGQTMTIENIPVGISYEVTEMEANQGGYTTTMEGNQGNISYAQENLSSFVNHMSVGTKISSASPTSQSDVVKTGDTHKWFVYIGLFLCAAFAGILILKKNKRLLSIMMIIGIGSTLLGGGLLYGIHHTSVRKATVSKTENDLQEEELSVDSQTTITDSSQTTITDSSQAESSLADKRDSSEDEQIEREEKLPSGSSAIQIKLSEGGNVTVCDEDENTYTEEGSASDAEEVKDDTNDTNDTKKTNKDQLLTVYKTDGTSTKVLITADDGYVISSFTHLEDGQEIDDGPSAEDLSKNVTMVIPASQTTTYIEVTFSRSEVLTDAEEEDIAEEEEALADGDMVLVSLMDTDSDFAEDTMSDQIMLASADAQNEESDDDSGTAGTEGESLLVSDASLPSTVTVYNTGHVINYSHYGGSSSETDLYHVFSSSDDATRRTAYCVEPGKSSPVYNKSQATLQISSIANANLYKVLYYGYGGPGDITGSIKNWTTDDCLIFTRLCVVYAYSGQNQSYTFQSCSNTMISRTMDLWNTLMQQPDPIDYMKFTPALQTVSADSNTSSDIYFEASAGNSVDITIPDGVSLYNRTRPKYNCSNGNTKIYAGDTFYLTTENKDYTFNSGLLKGNVPSMLMFITESLNNTRQRLVGWVPETLQAGFQVHWSDQAEIEKSVDRQSNNVGEKQTWQIEAEIPNEPISSYEITDQLDQRLNYEGNVTVSIESDTERNATAYTGNSYIYDGIDWSPVFDPEWYSSYYPDIKKAYGDDTAGMLKHFVTTGIYDGHKKGRLGFDIDVYKNDPAINADLKKAYGDDVYAYYRHYCVHGINEGRTCNKLDEADYSVSFDESSHCLKVQFNGSNDVLKNYLDKLTVAQNCKIVITFETSINEQALAGEKIENISLLNVNKSASQSQPVTVYTGAAKVKKTDSEGKALAGAKFAIYSVTDDNEYPVVLNENNQPVNYGDEGYSQDLQQMTATSDQNGLALFYGLKDGDYIFREIEAPEGYVINENASDRVTVSSGTVSETSIPVIEDQKNPGTPSKPLTLNTGGPGDKGTRTLAAIIFIIFVYLWGNFRKKSRKANMDII